MWLQYTATRRQRAATAGLFLTGAVLIAVAAHLSYANIEPSRAKAARRRKVFEAFIARKQSRRSRLPSQPGSRQTLVKPEDHALRVDSSCSSPPSLQILVVISSAAKEAISLFSAGL